MNTVKQDNVSVEERKNLFINCCYNHRDLLQPLFLLFKYRDECFVLVNAMFDFLGKKN